MSRRKFVAFFIIGSFVFLFITTSLLGSTGLRGFPKPPDAIVRTGYDSPSVWKQRAAAIILPVKAILIGPIGLPQIHFLEEDPPPPFIVLYLIFYWTILASAIHYLINFLRRSRTSVSYPEKF